MKQVSEGDKPTSSILSQHCDTRHRFVSPDDITKLSSHEDHGKSYKLLT